MQSRSMRQKFSEKYAAEMSDNQEAIVIEAVSAEAKGIPLQICQERRLEIRF